MQRKKEIKSKKGPLFLFLQLTLDSSIDNKVIVFILLLQWFFNCDNSRWQMEMLQAVTRAGLSLVEYCCNRQEKIRPEKKRPAKNVLLLLLVVSILEAWQQFEAGSLVAEAKHHNNCINYIFFFFFFIIIKVKRD